MSYQVLITSRAQSQLAAAAQWWAEHRSNEQAARWLAGFEQAIAALCERAEQHGLARENNLYRLPYPVRQLLYGIGKKPTHRAVFEIRGETVYIVAVRHLAQADLSATEL